MNYIVLLTALAPVVIFLFYIYRKDRYQPEPLKLLVKAFVYGLLSVFVSLSISKPLSYLGLNPADEETFTDCIKSAFFGAAIPEESAKLFMLWLVLRKNRFFDEKIDGIVYAVCVSLGFAAFENILYLFNNYDNFVAVGINRAIFSIPGHLCFGILMGYYYSLVKFYPLSHLRHRFLTLAAPVIAHGIYDSILFVSSVSTEMSGILSIVFLYFCYGLWKSGKRHIEEHLRRDAEHFNNL